MINSGSAVIVAASIGALGTIIAGLIGVIRSIHEMRNLNSKDHGVVQEKLQTIKEDVHEIKQDVKALDSRIDGHLIWHMDKEGEKV